LNKIILLPLLFMTWNASAEVDLMKVRSTNSNQSIELEEIHNALSNFSKSEDKVNIIYEQRRREMLESVERRFILCDSDNNEQLDVYETTVCLPQIARQFRRVDTDNDNLISFDEMAILAKAYQDNINSNQDANSQTVKIDDKPSPATAQKKKTKTKEIN
jgi:Ca2+-binding EF-hand superfamily protein